jgi:hypothetical protein
MLRNAVILALLVSSLQILAAGADFSTRAGAESFIENFVLSSLPEPTGDVVAVVKNSPEIIKAGLQTWLRTKMTDAATNEDWTKFDRYNAFYTCINGDCDALQALEKSTSPEAQQGQESTVPTSGSLAANGTSYQKGALLVGPISLHADWTDPQDILFLDLGRPYIIVGDGTCSLWDNPPEPDGVDSCFVYAKWRIGDIPQIWGQLELVDPSTHLSDLIEENTGKPAVYNPSHIYEAVIFGEGKMLKARVFDGGGYSDNHGELRISVYQAI